jgi:uncharacterized radical SAM protein YgiQ
MTFLPLNIYNGTDPLDVVLITGDAYVDHPSFGASVIARVLEFQGFRVGIIAMPDWKNAQSVAAMGKPRLFFGVTSGNVDSMIARYTAFKMPRSDDPYAPGGGAGRKPERAVIVYCNMIKSIYKDVPIVIGGIEASMRRMVHYDFWSDKVRRSILQDSRADILVYGMGEKAIAEIAHRLKDKSGLQDIPGTVIVSKEKPEKSIILPPEEEAMHSLRKFVEFYRLFYQHHQKVMVQPAANRFIIHYPAPQLSTKDMDDIYALPFERRPHPVYREAIPAFEMIQDSITAHRGCVSGCAFCSLTLHQGKKITSRSSASVLAEVKIIAGQPGFKGHITDIGGPSANNYGLECRIHWHCPRESCTFPELCPNLSISAQAWISLLQRAARQPGVTKVTVGSGIRYDLLMRDPQSEKWLKTLLTSHTGGQLKIAPEHTRLRVLRAMHKTPLVDMGTFMDTFRQITRRLEKKYYPLPYLMSNHPGCDLNDMQQMKIEIKRHFGTVPEQVQAFIPLPMTISSVIYHAGEDPVTGEKFSSVKTPAERRRQHNIFFDDKK